MSVLSIDAARGGGDLTKPSQRAKRLIVTNADVSASVYTINLNGVQVYSGPISVGGVFFSLNEDDFKTYKRGNIITVTKDDDPLISSSLELTLVYRDNHKQSYSLNFESSNLERSITIDPQQNKVNFGQYISRNGSVYGAQIIDPFNSPPVTVVGRFGFY